MTLVCLLNHLTHLGILPSSKPEKWLRIFNCLVRAFFAFGVRGNLLSQFKSYLTDRWHRNITFLDFMTPHSFTLGATLRLMHIPISSGFSKLQVSFPMKQRNWIQCPDLWTPTFFIPEDLGELFKWYLVAFPPIVIKVISMFRCLGVH